MSLTVEEKEKIMEEFKTHPKDTGSPQVQIAVLSRRISNMTEHLKKNKKDHGSKKGLYRMVSRRKKLLEYLRKKSPQEYQKVVEKLGLRG